MRVYYRGIKGSNVVRANLDSASVESAKRILNSQGIILSYIGEKPESLTSILSEKFKHVSKRQLVVLFSQLASMFKASVPPSIIFETLADAQEGYLKTVLTSISVDIKSGMQLSDAFCKFPNVFDEYTIAMVQVGEANGRFDAVFESISETKSKDFNVMGKVKSALVYPVSLLCLCVAVIILMSVVVVPQFAEIYNGYDQQLPGITLAMIGISAFLRSYGILLLVVIVAAIITLMRGYRRNIKVRKGLQHAVRIIKPIKVLLQTKVMAKYCRVMASLLSSGTSMPQALSVVHDILGGDVSLQESFVSIMTSLRAGNSLATSISTVSGFTPLVINMTKIGSDSGKLSDVYFNTAELYEEDIRRKTMALVALLEPITTVILGFVVFGIALAVTLPMFSIYSMIQ